MAQRQPKTAVVLFARAPELERKALGLSDGRSLKVQRALLTRAVEAAEAVQGSARLVLALEGELSDPDLLPEGAACLPQRGQGFEARLLNALDDAKALGFERLIVIGSDAPELGTAELRAALNPRSPQGWVLGPAVDGGLYLIALNAADLPLLRGLPWRTGTLCAALRTLLAEHGRPLRLLRPLRDLDSEDDARASWSVLVRLCRQAAAVQLCAARAALNAWRDITSASPLLQGTTPLQSQAP